MSAEVAAEAFVHEGAQLGEGVVVCPFAYIDDGVVIGARSVIGAGAVLLPGTTVGEDCLIGPETVLGSTGFGYVLDAGQHKRVPQVGRLEVGDASSIGPGCCIDRAALDVTRIGKNCQIGALVQIGHNCQLGEDSRIGSGSGLSGSTRIGKRARFGNRVGPAGHSNYGDDVVVDDLGGMTRTEIPSGTRWAGFPGRRVKG